MSSVFLLAFTAPAFAIGTPFSISGQVIDANGNALPGANVTLVDNAFNILAIKNTNEDGNYDFINVVSQVETVTVKVNFTKDGRTYVMPQYFVRWYPAKGMQNIPSKETQMPSYPEPVYGYVYGAIQSSTGSTSNFINGIVYLASMDNQSTYYEVADRTDGKGSYMFYVPSGAYVLYAQHWENGVAYESVRKGVTIGKNSDPTEVIETRIILPLNTPVNNPDPASPPAHYDNKITGTVTTKDGKPVKGATVTLLQEADNQTGFLPMAGSDSRPVTAATDNNGNYEFNGVAPTSDTGKAIQAKKDIKVMVRFTDSNGMDQTILSEPKLLYYPDVILGYGAEVSARSITLPVTLPIYSGTPPQSTLSVSEVPGPSESAGVAVVPMLAALAIGLACIIGVYVLLNRKGN